MALEHQCEAAAHFGRRRADGDGPGDIGRAVRILAARIDQIERAWLQLAVGLRCDPIVHDGAVRAGAGNRVEAQVAEQVGVAAIALQPVGGGEFVDTAARRFPGQPGQEAGERGAVPPMGVARPFQFHRVLARLGKLAGVGVPLDQRAGRSENLKNPVGGSRGIDQHLAAGNAGKRRFERVRRLDGDAIAQMLRQRAIDLAGRRKQADAAIVAQDGEGQRKRRARDVPTANIEQPGDRIGQGEHRGFDTPRYQLFGQRRAFVGRSLAGEFRRMDFERGVRPARPILPKAIDRVLRNRHECRADRCAGRAQPRRALRRMEPRIVAQLSAAAQRLAQPVRCRLIGDVSDLENRGIDLAPRPAACSGRRQRWPPFAPARSPCPPSR